MFDLEEAFSGVLVGHVRRNYHRIARRRRCRIIPFVKKSPNGVTYTLGSILHLSSTKRSTFHGVLTSSLHWSSIPAEFGALGLTKFCPGMSTQDCTTKGLQD